MGPVHERMMKRTARREEYAARTGKCAARGAEYAARVREDAARRGQWVPNGAQRAARSGEYVLPRGGRRAAASIAVGLAAILLPAGAPAQEFTIEQVLSAPFPDGLVASPVTGAVAWVQNAEGVRNIWVAESPDFRGRQVTNYELDDGQTLSDLQFTPDGHAVVYVRGGGPNRAGETPNPTSHADGAERGIWIVPASGEAAPRRIAEGGSPAVSPTGDIVAFPRQGAIWSVTLTGDVPDGAGAAAQASAGDRAGADVDTDTVEAQSNELADVRGSPSSLAWSPDGSQLAFVSGRGDHAFVGVYDVATGTIRYLDPGLAQDSDPVWSPDGRRIAFIRRLDDDDGLPFMPRRTALPWSIRVADVATGAGREVWRADVGTGSAFYGVSAESQILWGANDRLVFPWEKDGWLHLWSVPVDDGGRATLLTPPGECTASPARCGSEVQHVALSPDRETVVYSSNRGDIDRKHVWRVPVDGSRAPEAVTTGQGIEWSPVVTGDGGAIAFLASDATTPAHAEVVVGDGERRMLAAGSIPDDFPGDALVTPQQVVFPAADGMLIHGQLFLPPDLARARTQSMLGAGRTPERSTNLFASRSIASHSSGVATVPAGRHSQAVAHLARRSAGKAQARHPAVLFFHGGSRRQMLLGFHHRGYYHNAYALNQYLASRGYIVLAVNYRSGIGYGMEFREALNYGASGASEFNDVLGAGLYLRSRPDVDPQRIGLWGGSYGGYLTALGLARASDLFAAGVDLHGVHDWNVVIRNFVPSYEPDHRPDVAQLAFESSPMASIDDWRSPVLLIHGDDDRNVPFSESVDLVTALRERGVAVEHLVFPDEVHGFLLHRNWLAAYRATADFFDRRLRDTRTARIGGGSR